MTPLAGNPFGVVTTRDCRWVFVSGFHEAKSNFTRSSGDSGAEIAVLSNRGFAPRPVRVIELPRPSAAGDTITHDGRYLLVAVGNGAAVVDVARAESGARHPVVGFLAAPVSAPGQGSFGSAIEVATSPNDEFAFVALEYSDEIAVFNLRVALADRFRSPSFVGTITLGRAVVGMAFSPDGRWLYATSEVAASTTFHPGQYGTLSVINVHRAETTPSSSVVQSVPAGCGTVRVAVSPDGRVVWVTARESDSLLAFSAAQLVDDPKHALLAKVRVGEAPVGVAVIDHGAEIAVADSNRFLAAGQSAGLSIIDSASALAGKPALVGIIRSGKFPRELALEADGKTLLVTNFASGQLEAVDVTQLP